MAELFRDAEFWVLVGFLIFFGLVGRTGWRLLKGGLDARAKAVTDQLEEARRLREEAQNLLDGYRAKQEQALKDASEILEAAKEEAELMRREGEEALKRSLAAREAQATDRIAQAEQAAVQSVRGPCRGAGRPRRDRAHVRGDRPRSAPAPWLIRRSTSCPSGRGPSSQPLASPPASRHALGMVALTSENLKSAGSSELSSVMGAIGAVPSVRGCRDGACQHRCEESGA